MKRFYRFAIVLAVLLTTVQTGQAQEIRKEAAGLYATTTIKTTKPFKPTDRLLIQSVPGLKGKLTITAAESDEFVVRYVKKARAESKSKAVDYIDLIAVVIDATPEGPRLRMRAPNPPPWDIEGEAGIVELELVVPMYSAIEIEAQYFDVKAVGPFSKVLIPESLGRLDVSYVTEQLLLSTSNRRVSVNEITGKISVSTTNSTLRASNIEATKGRAVFRNSEGDIKIEQFVGEINVKNSFGRIGLFNFEPRGAGNLIRSVSGPIKMEIVKIGDANIKATNRHEDIEITLPTELSAVLSLSVEENGKIDVAGFVFTPELVEDNRLSLISGEGLAVISGSIRGKGNIYVRAIENEDQP